MGTRLSRIGVAVSVGAVGVTTALFTAVPATAAHWSHVGGDAGRSGFQPVDQGGVPAPFHFSRTQARDQDVRTSIITSAGTADRQRMIYGTADGRIHLRVLLTAVLVGPDEDLSASPNPFGAGADSVSFVETSTPTDLGRVLALHNEIFDDATPDDLSNNPVGIELAVVDATTGERVLADVQFPDLNGYRLDSSPVLGPADGAGNRSLYFVAGQVAGTNQRLFRLPITNPTSGIFGVGALTMTGDINAVGSASPTLVFLRDGTGAPTPYIAVSTLTGLRTFEASDLAVGGPSDETLSGPLRTPSTPVTPSGNPPGAAGSGVATTPVVYAAGGGPSGTTLYAFVQDGNTATFTRTASAALAGEPASGLMTDRIVTAADDGSSTGRVYVTTSANLYALRASDLAVVARFSPTDTLVAGSTGFRATIAAGTGSLVFVVTDGGSQLVLERGDLQPVDADQFSEAGANSGATAAFGQPSISRRFLQFATDRGVFAYALRRASPPTGYWQVASDGGIFAFGDAGFFGSTGEIVLNKPIVGMAVTPTRNGYWLVASDGGIFAFGDAGFFGSTGNIVLNKAIVGMAPTPTGLGYWLVASDGGIFAFGDAEFFGSTGDIVLNKPVVGMAVNITGLGYWLVATDGGIFAFGDAPFLGSTGDIALNQPVVAMAGVPSGRGYWLIARDGGVFALGRGAVFFGSTGALVLNAPIVGAGPSSTGAGYTFTASDGGLFHFGDAPFFGSTALTPLNRPVVGVAVKP